MAQAALDLKNRPNGRVFFDFLENEADQAVDRHLIHLTRSGRVIEKGVPSDHLLGNTSLLSRGGG
jgi:hypothetical protein